MSGYSLGTASGRITVDGSMAEKGFEVARSAANRFFQGINDQAQQVKDFGSNLQKASLVGVAGFGLAVKAASGFESRLSAVQAVSGATADQMDAISDAALRIGAETAFSASEAALAFEELIKAGISVEDALNGAADATAALAAAGEISLPRAAEIAANAMNNFNLAGADMPNIADKVAGAANASAISVEEFAQSMSQVGAVANLAGVSFDDTAIAIAAMGNAGIKGSDAGTSLKTVLMNLIPTTDAQVAKFQELGLMTYDAADAMADMRSKGIEPLSDSYLDIRKAVSDYLAATEGIPNDTKEMGKAVDDYLIKNGAMQNAFFDQEGKMKSLREVSEELAKSTSGLTKEQQLASLEVMFGADAIRGAAVLAKEGAAGFDSLAASIGAVTAEEVSTMRLDNLAGDIEEFQGSVETLMIKIGQAIMPVVRWLVQGATQIVNKFNDLNDTFIEWAARMGLAGTVAAGVVGTLIQLAAAAGPLIVILLTLRKGFAALSVIRTAFAGVSSVSGAFVALGSVLGSLVRTLFPIVNVIMNLGAAFVRVRGIVMAVAAVFSGPIGIAIGIVSALVALGVLLYNTWEPFRNLIDGIAAFFVDVWQGAIDGARQAWENFTAGLAGTGPMEGVTGAANTLGLGIRALGEAFQSGDVTSDGFVGAMERIGVILRDVWGALQETGGVIRDSFMSAWEQVSGIFESTLLPALQSIGDAFMNDLLPALSEAGSQIMGSLIPALQGIWSAVGPVIGFILQLAGALLGGFFTALFTVVGFLLGTVLPALIRFAGPVIGGLISAIAAVAGWIITYLITPFAEFIAFLVGTVIPGIIEFGSALASGIGEAFGAVAEWVSGAWTAITDFFSGLTGGAEEAGNGAKAGIGGFFDSIRQWFADAVQNVADFLGTVGAAIANFFQPLVDGFTAVFNFLSPLLFAIAGLVTTVFTGIWGVITALWNFIFNLTMYVWTSIFGIIVDTVVNIYNTVVQWLTSAWNFITMVFTAIWTTIVSIWTAIQAFISPIVQAIVMFISTMFWNLVSFIQTALSAIWGVITTIWNAIVAFMTPILTAIWNTVTTVWNAIVSTISAALSAVWSVITSIWNAIVGFISPIIESIRSSIVNGFNAAKDGVVGAVNTLADGVRTGIDNAYNFVIGIKDKVIGFFADAGSWLVNAGANIINGLRQGLENAFGGIQDTLNGLTDMIPDWKGPEKRDKILLKPAGAMIMKSLAEGLGSEMDRVYDLLNSMNTDIPLSMKAVLSPQIPNLDGSMYVKSMPIGAERLPVPAASEAVAGDVYNTTLNHVPTDHAQETAETILFNQRVKSRGGKYSKVRK